MVYFEILKFVFLVIIVIALFFAILKYFANRTAKKETEMLEDLAQELGFSFFEEDKANITTKIRGLFDFGLSKIAIEKNVFGNYLDNEIFFFELDDEYFHGSGGGQTPTWSVCLLKLPNKPRNLDLLYFHKNLFFGKMKKYKDLPKDWSQIKLDETGLKNYHLMLKNPENSDKRLVQKIIPLFAKYRSKFKKRIIPREISLQINGNYIAIYADMWNFEKKEEYLICFDFIKELVKIL